MDDALIRHNPHMGHSHSNHDHSHPPGPDPHDHHAHISGHGLAAFRFGTLLNLGLVAAEAAVGFAVGSMALLADAGHNLGDVLGLVLAWIAAKLALRRPSPRHTYGMARSTILAALLNASLLLVACGALATESIRRLGAPAPVPGLVVMGMAALGFVVNAATAMLFWRGRRFDLNERGAFLHMAADAAVSLAVVVVGGLMALTGWHWLDPVAGLAIAVAILLSGLGLLRESVELSLDAVPRGLDLGQIDGALRAVAGVTSLHDLHVWPLSTTVTALTAHLEHDGTRDTDTLLVEVQSLLLQRFGIGHSTIQFENVGCGQRC
jgi:cobalt-zinc-cadmium efflux system protein